MRIRGARVLRVQADGVRQISLLSFSRIHRVTIFFERTFRFRIVAIFPSAWALRALRWLCRVTQFLECIARKSDVQCEHSEMISYEVYTVSGIVLEIFTTAIKGNDTP